MVLVYFEDMIIQRILDILAFFGKINPLNNAKKR